MAIKILILGAGELGIALASAILDHKVFNSQKASLTVAVRPETLSSFEASPRGGTVSPKYAQLDQLACKDAAFISINLVDDSEDTLASTFSKYTTVIHAGAMTLPPGVQLRITRAALAAKVLEYVPWQWGVDYDVIGPDAGGGLFAEAYQVRQLLRSQQTTKWWIVSCGIFMSFLFEESWGVVARTDGAISGVRALGGWDHLVTATHVSDIAKVNSELLLVDRETRNCAVYIAGVTMTFDELAVEISKVLNAELKRELWTTENLERQSVQAPDNKLLKYRVVFSEDKGLAWEKAGSYADTRGPKLGWNIERFVKEFAVRP